VARSIRHDGRLIGSTQRDAAMSPIEAPLGVNPENTNSAVSDLEPSHVSGDAANYWWTAPVSNRVTAAYHFGRLVNQLNWHLQNELFFIASLRNKRMIAEILNRLVAVSYRLVCKPSNHLEDAIIDVRESLDGWLHCEAAAEEVAACFDDYKQHSAVDSSEERRKELVGSRAHPLIDKLRECVWIELLETEKCALKLGECLDQGIRCPDLHRFMEAESFVHQGWHANDQHGSSSNWLETGLALQSYVPGELEPDPAWFASLMELLAMTGVPVARGAAILTTWQNQNAQDRLSSMSRMLEQLDLNIREHLSSCGNDSTGTQPLEYSNPVQSYDRDLPTNGVGGQPGLAADDRNVVSGQVSADHSEALLGDVESGTPVATGNDCYVTLLQMAAIVNRKKRCLEGLKKNKPGFPPPAVKSTGGSPNEWLWSQVRPHLEKEYKRSLPEVFPSAQFVP
jgi:hypothetical protein